MDSSFERSAALVKEWLRFHGYTGALQQMERPPTIRSEDLASSDQGPDAWRQELVDKMVRLLAEGERERFWAQWGANIPGAVLDKDIEIEGLWLSLLAHFACRPMPHMHAPDGDAVQDLQSFLHSRSSSLGGQPDYMLYCALPFIPRPDLSPQFKHIYTAEWLSALQKRLEATLSRVVSQPSWPRIYSLMSKGDGVPTRNENEVRGGRDESMGGGGLGISFDTDLRSDIKSLGLSLSGVPLWPIDYGKVRNSLATGEPADVAHVMQALRWRLLRCGKMGRATVLADYVSNDVLELKQGNSVVNRLLSGEVGERRREREECARFLSCLSTYSAGRSYLLLVGAEWLVESLFAAMRSESGDSRLRQHLLGCLQKCSLRRMVQDHAIAVGGVEWTLSILQDADSLSEYTVEYATAFLLNLTLRTAGKDRCEQSTSRCLEALIDLLEYDNLQVKQYVHGTLYAILNRGSLKEKAKSLGLGEMLQALADVYRSQTNMPLAAQIDCIADLLSLEPPASDFSDPEDEPEASNEPPWPQSVPAEDVYSEGPEDAHDVLPQTRQGDGLRGSELLYARFCPAASRVPRKSYPRGSELLDDQMDGSLSPDKSPARQLPNATHASPMPPHRPTTPGFANNSSYRSPSVMREPNHAEEGAGDMQPDLDYTAHVSIEPSSPGRAPSLETSFSTPGPRRVQTPPPDRLDAIRQKAQGQEVSVEEMKVVFGGQSRLARTPPNN